MLRLRSDLDVRVSAKEDKDLGLYEEVEKLIMQFS